MKLIKYQCFFAVLAALLLSCAGFSGSVADSQSFAAIDSAVYNGGYDEAIETLETDKAGLYNEKALILYKLDSGLLNHYAENYGDSIGHLQEAERLIEDAYTKSISQRETAGFGGENILDYESEDFEDIYINVFNALNYYHQNQLEDAIVEIRRMNNKLDFFQTKYRASSREERAQVERGGNAAYVSSKFSNSALGRYLGVLFHRANGNQDSVRIDYNWLTAAFNNAPEIYDFPLPSSAEEELAVPAGKARLNVIAFSGLAPVKKADLMKYPTYENQSIELALPVLESRPSAVSRIEAVFDDGKTIELEKLEHIEAVYRETYQVKLHNVTLVRTALRASIMGTGKDLSRVDIRSSRYFPAWAFVNGINLNPGVYSFTVHYYDAGGQIIHSAAHDNFEVKEGTLNLAETYCFK